MDRVEIARSVAALTEFIYVRAHRHFCKINTSLGFQEPRTSLPISAPTYSRNSRGGIFLQDLFRSFATPSGADENDEKVSS
jgi:hypothetical protein